MVALQSKLSSWQKSPMISRAWKKHTNFCSFEAQLTFVSPTISQQISSKDKCTKQTREVNKSNINLDGYYWQERRKALTDRPTTDQQTRPDQTD